MVEFTMNGRQVRAEEGETLLKIARREGFVIPTLCHHEALGSDGRCRLCVVEVHRGTRRRIVTSCLYQVEADIAVLTESEDVRLVRRTVLELLLARNPSSEVIGHLAGEYGVKETRYRRDNDKGKCILCNTCVRACDAIVGVSALSMSGKGPHKRVATPFDEASPVCIGCGACAAACPTGHIYMEDRGGIRTIWRRRFELAVCPHCGRHHAPVDQLKYIAERAGVSLEQLLVCQDCK